MLDSVSPTDTATGGCLHEPQRPQKHRVPADGFWPWEAPRSVENLLAGSVGAEEAAVNPSAGGYLTVFLCGVTPPLAANVNYSGGDIAANAVLAEIGAGGKVCVFTLAATDLVIDVNGFTPAGTT